MTDVPDVLLALRGVLVAAVDGVTGPDQVTPIIGGVDPAQHLEGDLLVVGTPREGRPAVQETTIDSGWGGRETTAYNVQCDLQLVHGGDTAEDLLELGGRLMSAMRAAVRADDSLGGIAAGAQFGSAAQWDIGRGNGQVWLLVGFEIEAQVSS